MWADGEWLWRADGDVSVERVERRSLLARSSVCLLWGLWSFCLNHSNTVPFIGCALLFWHHDITMTSLCLLVTKKVLQHQGSRNCCQTLGESQYLGIWVMRGLPSIDVTWLTSQAFGEPISGRFMGFACVTGNPRLGSWLRVEPMPMQFWIMFIVLFVSAVSAFRHYTYIFLISVSL